MPVSNSDIDLPSNAAVVRAGNLFVVANLAERDALAGLRTDSVVHVRDRDEFYRYDGSGYVIIGQAPYTESAIAHGAVAGSHQVGMPAEDSLDAINATIYAAMAEIDDGQVLSASNDNNGYVTLTKKSSNLNWGVTPLVTVLRTAFATGGTTTTLVDAALGAVGDQYATALLVLTEGKGANLANRVRSVYSNIATELVIDSTVPYTEAPDATTRYQLLATREQVDGSFHDVALTFDLAIYEGKGKGHSRTIIGQVGSDTVRLDRAFPADAIPDSTSRFKIVPSALTAPPRFFNKSAILPGGPVQIKCSGTKWLNALRGGFGAVVVGQGQRLTSLIATGGKSFAACTNVTTTANTFTDTTPGLNWLRDEWKDMYLVLWLPDRTRRVEIRILSNTGTASGDATNTLTLDQAAWPLLYSGAVTAGPPLTASEFNDNLFPAHFAGDAMRYMSLRFTSGALNGQSRVVNASSEAGNYTFQMVTGFTTAPAIGNTFVIEDRPVADWSYAIAVDSAMELNGVADSTFYDFTVEGRDPSEILRLLSLTWRRPYSGANRQSDFSVDPYRSARSNSQNVFHNVGAAGRWIIDGIKVGNVRKGGNFQIDLSQWFGPAVIGLMNNASPVFYTHWENNMTFGSDAFGNNVGHSMFAPRLTAAKHNLAIRYTGLVSHAGYMQSAWRNVHITGISDYTEITAFRSELSGGLIHAPYNASKHNQSGKFAGLSFKVDGASYLAGDGAIIKYSLASANMQMDRIVTEAGDPAPITGQTAAGSVNERTITSLTRVGATATAVSAGHGYSTGDTVTVAGADQPEYNIAAVITVIDPNTWTYTVSGTPATPATGSIVTRPLIRLDNATMSRILAAGELNSQNFVLVFLNTALAGTFGTISTNISNTVTLSAPLPSAPIAGVNFEITESAYSPATYTAAAGSTTVTIRLAGVDFLPDIHLGQRAIVKTGAAAGSNVIIGRHTKDRLYLQQPTSVAVSAGDTIVIPQGRTAKLVLGSSTGELIATATGLAFIGTEIDRLVQQPLTGGGRRLTVIGYKELDRNAQERSTWEGGKRYTIDGWYRDNVIANLVNQTLTRNTGAGYAPNAWIARTNGFLIGLGIKLSEPRTAGTLTLKVFKNGVDTGAFVTIDATNPTFVSTRLLDYTYAFAAGDELDLRISTDAGWLPVTADVRGFLDVETNQ
jgi:hypothetical protein